MALTSSNTGPALTVIAMCAVAVSVFWWEGRGDGEAEEAARAALPAADSPVSDAHRTPTVLTSSAAPPVQLADTQGVDAELPIYDASAQPPVETAPAETAGADPANERAAAIRASGERGENGNGAEQLGLLTQTLRTDEFARNRLLAINGLRSRASDPALRPQVLEALRAAQADRDANVSRNAGDAVAELSRF